ncbi:hypothetical protein TI39_contig4199g00013 [Zymoseptoria brevis]|uniref:Uncharacterized protein n=1 Tax=Zymoseptoria brevis TaxID=1047168 RepID=A0A0F4GDV9_9PEZI|nr:hypothetical protein TI39_contig4199g00013 [Zymoseptoria brevis]
MENSPFNRIPAEVRNHIYFMALANDAAIPARNVAKHTGFLQTCRQIRGEAQLLFWAVKEFHVHIGYPVAGATDQVESFEAILRTPMAVQVLSSMAKLSICIKQSNYSRSIRLQSAYGRSIPVYHWGTMECKDCGKRHDSSVVFWGGDEAKRRVVGNTWVVERGASRRNEVYRSPVIEDLLRRYRGLGFRVYVKELYEAGDWMHEMHRNASDTPCGDAPLTRQYAVFLPKDAPKGREIE